MKNERKPKMKRSYYIPVVLIAFAIIFPAYALLKGVSPVVSPELLKTLAEMGHGDEIVFADAHFPVQSIGVRVIRADGLKCDEMLRGVIPLMELDAYATPVVMMAPVPGDKLDPDVEKRYRAALRYDGKIDRIERFAFYERARKACAIVLTGETAIYGNVIVKKGIVPSYKNTDDIDGERKK